MPSAAAVLAGQMQETVAAFVSSPFHSSYSICSRETMLCRKRERERERGGKDREKERERDKEREETQKSESGTIRDILRKETERRRRRERE